MKFKRKILKTPLTLLLLFPFLHAKAFMEAAYTLDDGRVAIVHSFPEFDAKKHHIVVRFSWFGKLMGTVDHWKEELDKGGLVCYLYGKEIVILPDNVQRLRLSDFFVNMFGNKTYTDDFSRDEILRKLGLTE